MANLDRQPQTNVRPKRRLSWLRYLLLAVIIVVVVGGFAGGTFYEREIRLFVTQRAWNKGAAAGVVKRFIDLAQDSKIDEAMALVDSGSYEPLSKDNKVIGLQHVDPSGMARYRVFFNEFIPSGDAQVQSIYLTTSDKGGFVVSVKFGDGSTGDFLVRFIGGEYKITGIPMVEGRFHF